MKAQFSVLSRVISPRLLRYQNIISAIQLRNLPLSAVRIFRVPLSLQINEYLWPYDLCKMKLRLNRRPDTVRNVVLNPRNKKLAFREESRKSISYLKRGDEKKDKSRGGDAGRGIRVTRVRRMVRDDTSGEQTIKIVKSRAHQFYSLSRGHETRDL